MLPVGTTRGAAADEDQTERLTVGHEPLSVQPDEPEGERLPVIRADGYESARLRNRELLETEPPNVAERNALGGEQVQPV